MTREELKRRAFGAFPVDDEVIFIVEKDSVEHNIDSREISKLIHFDIIDNYNGDRVLGLCGSIKYKLDGVKYIIKYTNYIMENEDDWNLISYTVSLDVPKEKEKEVITCLTAEEEANYGEFYHKYKTQYDTEEGYGNWVLCENYGPIYDEEIEEISDYGFWSEDG